MTIFIYILALFASNLDFSTPLNHFHGIYDLHSLELGFNVEPESKIVPINGNVLLDCQYNINSSSKKVDYATQEGGGLFDARLQQVKLTRIDVEWREDGLLVAPIHNFMQNGSLWIDNFLPSDEGIYQCAVHVSTQSTASGQQQNWIYLSRRAFVSSQSIHRFEEQPADQTVRIGQNAAFRCALDSKPPATVEWYRDNSLVTSEKENMHILPSTQTLEIKDVQLHHSGAYKCVAKNGNITRTSQLAILTVMEGDEGLAPQSAPWLLQPRTQFATEGHSVLLECLLKDNGKFTTNWLFNSTQPIGEEKSPFGRSFTFVGPSRTHLFIPNVKREHSGQYTCRMENKLGVSMEAEGTLVVRVPPKIVRAPDNMFTQETNDVEFECVADGVPAPRLTWYKNGEMIVPSEYFVIAANKLQIFGLVNQDQGVYQCIADNEVGSDQANAILLVYQSATHLPLVSSLFDDAQSATRQLQTPNSPNLVQVLKASTHSIALSWDPPAAHKSDPTLFYTIFYREDKGTRELSVNSTQSSIVIDHLQANTKYSVRIVAFNKAGPGRSSEPINVTTHSKELIPGKVKNLRAQVLSSESIQIDWDEPESNEPVEMPIQDQDLRYKLLYSLANDELKEGKNDEETQIIMLKRSYILHGLRKNTLYSMRVVAENLYGNGPFSDTIFSRTHSDIPSLPPNSIISNAVGPDSVQLIWEHPPRDSWNGPLIGYRMRYKLKGKGGAKAKNLLIESTEREYTLGGLEAASVYMLRMAAVNQNGTGPWSDWIEIATSMSDREETQIAGAPSELRVDAQHDSILVQWTPPRDQDVLIRGYQIGWGVNIPDVEKTTVDQSVRQYTIRGLRPNREYVISLRAFNQVGYGFPIYETVRTTSYGTGRDLASRSSSSAPENNDIMNILTPIGVIAETVSSTQVRLFWVDPNEDAFNQYYIIKYKSGEMGDKDRQVNVSDTEYTLDGLQPNTQYEFAVRMANSLHWSLTASNRTFASPPSSPPRDVTVIGPSGDEEPTAVTITWQPPKYANGEIQEYILLYSDRQKTQEDQDWVVDSVKGDRLSIRVQKLTPGINYHFKMQARNAKGYGPFSPPVGYTLHGKKDSDPTRIWKDGDQNGEHNSLFYQLTWLLSNYFLFLLIGFLGFILLLAIIIALLFKLAKGKQSNGRRRQKRQMPEKRQKQNRERSPANSDDLWIRQSGGRIAAILNTPRVIRDEGQLIEDFDSIAAMNCERDILLNDHHHQQQKAFGTSGVSLENSSPFQMRNYYSCKTPTPNLVCIGTLPRNCQPVGVEMMQPPSHQNGIQFEKPSSINHFQPKLATMRSPHIVYTKTDRQPIAKVDYVLEGTNFPFESNESCRSTAVSADHHQRRNGQSSSSTLVGHDDFCHADTNSFRNSMETNNANQNNANNYNSHQQQQDAINQTFGANREFGTKWQTTGVPQQQPKTANIVRPYNSSPGTTLRSAVGQLQQQQRTPPAICHRNGSGGAAKVPPVGRALAQPRVNISHSPDSSSSPYSSVRCIQPLEAIAPTEMPTKSAAAEGNAKNKTNDSAEEEINVDEIEEIDKMIDTLQQLQHEFTAAEHNNA